MSIKDTIASAGRNLHTIIITASEDNGSIETREAEPYSYRVKGDDEKFFCFDIIKMEFEIFICQRSFLFKKQRIHSHLVGP